VESDECENNGCGNSYGNNNIKNNKREDVGVWSMEIGRMEHAVSSFKVPKRLEPTEP